MGEEKKKSEIAESARKTGCDPNMAVAAKTS